MNGGKTNQYNSSRISQKNQGKPRSNTKTSPNTLKVQMTAFVLMSFNRKQQYAHFCMHVTSYNFWYLLQLHRSAMRIQIVFHPSEKQFPWLIMKHNHSQSLWQTARKTNQDTSQRNRNWTRTKKTAQILLEKNIQKNFQAVWMYKKLHLFSGMSSLVLRFGLRCRLTCGYQPYIW